MANLDLVPSKVRNLLPSKARNLVAAMVRNFVPLTVWRHLKRAATHLARVGTLLAWVRAHVSRWLKRRRAYRARLARAAWELRERYGPAAVIIARNSARAPGGPEARRFWRRVARRLAAG